MLIKYLEDRGVSGFNSDAATAGDYLPEIGGRNCYQSWSGKRPGGNRAYLEHIKEVGHFSVVEHSNFGFLISRVSRSLTHELVRHRHLSFSQLSQRFVNEEQAEYVMPPTIQGDSDLEFIWTQAVRAAHIYYEGLVIELEKKLQLQQGGKMRGIR